MSKVHPTAVIEDGASIADDVEVGAFAVIGPDVKIGNGAKIHPHVIISGHTTLGDGCEVFPFATLGEPPQDLKYADEPTELVIGSGTLIREHVTVHRGTPQGNKITRIGSNCFLMVDSHVAHDCVLGDNVVLINQATLAGHCEVGDFTIVGGLSALHQFVRVGKHSFVAGMTGIEHDIIPFGLAKGILRRAHLTGLNLVGMKRRGFSREDIHAVRESYREIFEGPTDSIRERVEAVAERFSGIAAVQEIVDFVRARPDRNLCLPQPANMNTSPAGL